MWRRLLLLAFCVSCGGEPDGIAPVVPDEPMRVVSGVLEDSVLSIPVAGVRVLIGDSSVVSDSQGRFVTLHRSGDIRLSVADYRFESYSTPYTVLGDDDNIQLRLRGEAPYLTSCTFGSELLTATLIDLQGRKTINRRTQSTTTVVGDGSSYRRDANTWSWTPIDNFTWLAHVPIGGVGADSAVWQLEDADGHVRSARCTNQPPPCVACAAKN